MKTLTFVISLLTMVATSATAQTYQQRGVVRMITTSASSPITPVAGVKVTVGNNISKPTNKNGQFAMQVMKQFQVNGVTPSDEYILALPTKGKTYYQSNNDLNVVVTTREQKETVSRDVYDRLLADYKKKVQELQSARDEAYAKVRELKRAGQDFTVMEHQRDSLQRLLLDYTNNISSFEEKFDALAEQLAITDFKSLSEKERRVYEMQMNGDWEGLSDFYNEIMNGDMESYLKNAVEFERRASELQRQADENKNMCFQDALSHIEALKMQHLNDSVSRCYEILTNADPGNWEYLNEAGRFECNFKSNFANALIYHNRAIALNPTDSLLATSYDNIGNVYSLMGEFQQALNYFKMSLELLLKAFGESHQFVGTCYSNIGNEYGNLGNFTKALDFHNKALEQQNKHHPERRLDIAMTYNNLGAVYQYMDELDTALDCFEKSLNIREEEFKRSHPDLAYSYSNIGVVFEFKGEFNKALEHFYKALEMDIEQLGVNHLNVIMDYINIGSAYDKLYDCSKAMEFYNKALEVGIPLLTENHNVIAYIYNNIGMIYDYQHKHQEALGYCEKALDIMHEFYSEDHPNIIQIKENISNIKESIDSQKQ